MEGLKVAMMGFLTAVSMVEEMEPLMVDLKAGMKDPKSVARKVA